MILKKTQQQREAEDPVISRGKDRQQQKQLTGQDNTCPQNYLVYIQWSGKDKWHVFWKDAQVKYRLDCIGPKMEERVVKN